MSPRAPRSNPLGKLSETAVGQQVASWVVLSGGTYYNAETGDLGHYEEREGRQVRVNRRGGNRSTPGTPDFPVVMMREPFPITLSVELKGSTTKIKPKDWAFCLDAATYGHPHLLVRSGEEFLTGLRYLGLLPDRLRDVHPVDWTAWPQNIGYLALTLERGGPWAEAAWKRRAQDGLPPGRFRTGWWDPDQLAAVMETRPQPPHPLARLPR